MISLSSLENGSLTPQKSTIHELTELGHTLESKVPGVRFTPSMSWQKCTTMGAGTWKFPFLEVFTVQQAAEAVRFLRCIRPPWKISLIGGGSNLIGCDKPLPLTVFLKASPGKDFSRIDRISTKQDQASSALFECGAACSLGKIVQHVLGQGYGGASGLCGIPGSLGGAVRMNAAAQGMSVGDFVETLQILNTETGEIRRVGKDYLTWGYHDSSLPGNEMILSAGLRFSAVNIEDESQKIQLELNRRSKAPRGRSAGSIFRNPSPRNPAGKILEEVGAKGLQCGSFSVSQEHANWIINRGDTLQPDREEDFIHLLEQLTHLVLEKKGIRLVPEVQFVHSK